MCSYTKYSLAEVILMVGTISFQIYIQRSSSLLLDTCTNGNSEWTRTIASCGWFHTAALTKMGQVYTWGSNSLGKLGHGDRVSRTIPAKVGGVDWVQQL